MKKLIICLITVTFFANFAKARIGETLPELVKRFGMGRKMHQLQVKAPNTAIYTFKKDGISIFAYFIGDKCEMISYSNLKGISEEEARALLKANGSLTRWLPDRPPKVHYPKSPVRKAIKSWSRDDYRIFATYIRNAFYVMTKNYKQKLQESMNKPKKTKSLDGF